jgi:hypothetical protein
MGFLWRSLVNPERSFYCTYEGFAPIATALAEADILDEDTELPAMPAEVEALGEAVVTDEDERRYEQAYFTVYGARSPQRDKIPAWKIVHADPVSFDLDEMLILARTLAPLTLTTHASIPQATLLAAFRTFLQECAELKGGVTKG